MAGSWEMLPEDCRPGSIDELGALAYPYTPDCGDALHLCDPGLDPVRECACC